MSEKVLFWMICIEQWSHKCDQFDPIHNQDSDYKVGYIIWHIHNTKHYSVYRLAFTSESDIYGIARVKTYAKYERSISADTRC